MKVRLELETKDGRCHLRTLDMGSIPRAGELFETGEDDTLAVMAVVHTPGNREHDAIVVLKKGQA